MEEKVGGWRNKKEVLRGSEVVPVSHMEHDLLHRHGLVQPRDFLSMVVPDFLRDALRMAPGPGGFMLHALDAAGRFSSNRRNGNISRS